MRAAEYLDEMFLPHEANAARRLMLRKAILTASEPKDDTRKFVLKHMDLLTPDDYGVCLIQAAQWLFTYCLPEAWQLLESSHPGFAFAKAFVVDAPEEQIIDSLGSEGHRAATVLEIRPELTTSKLFWRSSGAVIDAGIRHLASGPLSAEVLSAMLGAGTTELARRLSAQVPVENLFALLVEVSDSDPPGVAKEVWRHWFGACRPQPSFVTECMIGRSTWNLVTLSRLSRVVGPSAVPNDSNCDPWVSAYQKASGTLSSAEQRHLFCFLLARAFSQKSTQVGHLLKIAFDKVYSFAERSDLGEDDWEVVSDVAQPPRWWLAWDRCGTLRFAVAVLCRDKVLTPEEFLDCTDSDARFAALVKELSDRWWGRGFLKRALNEMSPDSPRRTLLEGGL